MLYLQDLRNLRSQLYSAAEYFEVFYRNNSHKSTYDLFLDLCFLVCLVCCCFNKQVTHLISFLIFCRVMTSLKDYTVEALVSTVDHLGFVSYKVDNLVSEKADEVNETEFLVSSVEQVQCLLQKKIL